MQVMTGTPWEDRIIFLEPVANQKEFLVLARTLCHVTLDPVRPGSPLAWT